MNDVKDLSPTIVPKSDQLNSEQLITGPITITVTAVDRAASADQPLIIHYDNEQGRPYKPCKTMRKVLIAAWGNDGSQWIGRSMTLFCDNEVKWAGEKVGGIRISHLSHLPEGKAEIRLSLTATRGKKTVHIISGITDALAEYRQAISVAADMDALVKAWSAIPKQHHAALSADKDRRKTELSQTGEAL